MAMLGGRFLIINSITIRRGRGGHVSNLHFQIDPFNYIDDQGNTGIWSLDDASHSFKKFWTYRLPSVFQQKILLRKSDLEDCCLFACQFHLST